MRLVNTHDWEHVERHGMRRADGLFARDTEGLYARTSRGRRIACVFVRSGGPGARRTIMHSHGNAMDVGHLAGHYAELGRRTKCHVFGYDYTGYGVSSGRPSERDLYADAEAAWTALRSEWGMCVADVVLYGQSIGTVAAVHLAARFAKGDAAVAAVVLQSPIASAVRVLFPEFRGRWLRGAFNNIDKVAGIDYCPVLVVHGKRDRLVDISHAEAIHRKCPGAVRPLWVEDAGHNDVEQHAAYWDRLERFIKTELLS